MHIPAIFKPIIKKSRYKSLRGGRGGMKSWTVARVLVEITMRGKYRILCARELQNSIGESVIQLLGDTIDRAGYTNYFDVQRNRVINLLTGSEFIFFGIKNNPTKIKSVEGVDIVWIEEAENVTDESWNILIPTIRKEGSEIWLTWNPKNILDPTYQRFVLNPPEDLIEIVVNYTDNPNLPDTLLKEAQECKEKDYQLYRHIWLGEPVADSEFAFIKPEWIEAAIDAHKKLDFGANGKRVIGFDVADDGGDKNATVLRHGSVVVSASEWSGYDVIHSADKVYNEAVKCHADSVVFDSIGVGAGVKAQFNRKGSQIKTIGFNAGASVDSPLGIYKAGKTNKDMFSNLKAQQWQMVADRFFNTWRAIKYGDKFSDDKLISISSDIKDVEYLKAELSRPRIDYDGNGRIKVESKKDLKKRGIPSPNKADAFIMAFASCGQSFYIPDEILDDFSNTRFDD